ncbi:MAG: hypothetical protein BroJett014_03950 [Planctomycetota bacterium]|nr:radical SAM protein [Planctomycetota bacterium]GIK51422.1 MAG: hypothetical protein BroJett014_03950 [Planctomycetota bacterium]
MSHASRTAATLPPTVNIHVIGSCNYDCHFCYARFVTSQVALPLPEGEAVLSLLAQAGVKKITFAGGEPTLHRDLLGLLRHARKVGMVTALVTNASLIDEEWCRLHLPELRWVVLSLDSAEPETCVRIGRHPKRGVLDHPAQVARVAEFLHRWNEQRPSADRVRLKVNMVVTSLNAHEDPSEFLDQLQPERVKLLQCGIRPGENDDAEHLRCDDGDFAAYAKRLNPLQERGITVVTEFEEDQRGSYAMIDPRGCFFQSDDAGRLTTSKPILQAGLAEAWREVGGYDAEKFVARGGNYDPGSLARGVPGAVQV